MTPEEIRIDYRRSGGLAGIDMTASVHCGELSADQTQVAADLLSGTVAPAPSANAMRDGFTYQLTVTDGSTTRVHEWSQFEVPDAVRPLLDTLGSRSSPGR